MDQERGVPELVVKTGQIHGLKEMVAEVNESQVPAAGEGESRKTKENNGGYSMTRQLLKQKVA